MSISLKIPTLPRIRADGEAPFWPLLLALALAAHLASPYLFGLFDGVQALTHFQDRAMGQTTLEGVDGSGYARNYVLLMSILASVSFVCFCLFGWLDRAFRARLSRAEVAAEYSGLERLGELLIALFGMRIIVRHPFMATLHGVLAAGVGLLLVVLGLKILARRASGRGFADALSEVLADHNFLIAMLFFPLPPLFVFQVALTRPIGFAAWSVLEGGALYVGLLAACLWAATLTTARFDVHGWRDHLMLAAFPLLLIPISIPLANEIQYSLPRFSPRAICLVLIGFWILLSALLLVIRWFRPGDRQRSIWSPWGLLAYGYFPVFVITNAVFKVYQHTLSLGDLDYFHVGEFTLPAHQWFNFSSIPLIDLRPAHTLSDLFYQSLYAWVHGDSGMDMLLWAKWMPQVVSFLLLYLFLAKLVSPTFALAATSLIPVLPAITSYYSMALVPALFLASALRRPTIIRFALLWASALGLALWRFDFGLVGGVALTLVLAVDLARRPARLKTMVLSLALVTGLGALVLLGVALVSHRPALETLVFLVKSYTFRLATRTRAEIIHQYSVVAVLQYYILPCISLIYILRFAVHRFLRGRYLPPRGFMLVYLAVFSLVLSVRSLERHSLVEGFNPYLFVLLVAMLPFFLSGPAKEDSFRRVLFYGVLVFNALFALPPSSFSRSEAYHIFKPGELFEFRSWRAGAPRVFYNSERHEDLVHFLTHRLEGDQTFYDFTNSPLLYVLANKKFPTYVIPNIIQTSETIQADVLADLTELKNQGLLKIVIFKQGNHFWDNVDHVPNEFRSYRIAEFIYQHFVPAVQMGRYQVWLEKNQADLTSTLEEFATHYSLPFAAKPRWNNLERLPSGGSSDQAEEIEVLAEGPDPYIRSLFDLEDLPPFAEHQVWRMRLKYRSTQAGDLQVFLMTDGGEPIPEESLWLKVVETTDATPAEVEVLIEVPSGAQRLTDIRFDPPEGSEWTFCELQLIGGEVAWEWLSPAQLTQHHELLQLPHIWAKYDPLAAVTHSAVVAELIDQPVSLVPGEALALRLDPNLEKSSGNYLHLRFRHDGPVFQANSGEEQVTIEYGEPPSSFAFLLAPDADDAHDRRVLDRAEGPVLHDAMSFQTGGRTIFRATGEDPYLHQVFDLTGATTMDATALNATALNATALNATALNATAMDGGPTSFLYLRYRSSKPGPLEVFFGFDWHWFEPDKRVLAQVDQTDNAGKSRFLMVPIPPTDGTRLTDVRFDFPLDGLFEIAHAEIVRGQPSTKDYLIRLSTQWAWTSQDIDQLRVQSNIRITLEKACLRQGD